MYEPTQEEIQSLKAKHGDVFKLTVGDKSCLMRSPTRKELSFASKAAEKDPLSFNEVILKNCFLAGDKEIRDDDSYFLGAGQQLSNLIQVKKASLEKL